MNNKVKIVLILVVVLSILLAIPCSASEWLFNYNTQAEYDEATDNLYGLGTVTWESEYYAQMGNYYAYGALPKRYPTVDKEQTVTSTNRDDGTAMANRLKTINYTDEGYTLAEYIDNAFIFNGRTMLTLTIPNISYQITDSKYNIDDYCDLEFIATLPSDGEWFTIGISGRVTYLENGNIYSYSYDEGTFGDGDQGDQISVSVLPSFSSIYDYYGGANINNVEAVSFTDIIVNIRTNDGRTGLTNGTVGFLFHNNNDNINTYGILHDNYLSNSINTMASEGYSNGYDVGFRAGYSRGHSIANQVLENAYNDGYDDGTTYGYNIGVSEAIGDLDVMSWLQNVSSSIMDVSITPALTIGGVLAFVIGLALFLTLLKYFRG